MSLDVRVSIVSLPGMAPPTGTALLNKIGTEIFSSNLDWSKRIHLTLMIRFICANIFMIATKRAKEEL